MTYQTRSAQEIIETLRSKGFDKEDCTLNWKQVAVPLAVELNKSFEQQHSIPLSMRKVCYKRFLGLIGGTCITDRKTSDGETVRDAFGEPQKHFSSIKLLAMFPKKPTKDLKLLPKFMKQYKTDGLNIS